MAVKPPQPSQADIERSTASIKDHMAIEAALPPKRHVLEHFRGKPGVVHARETPGGGVDILLDRGPEGLKRKLEYREMERVADRIENAHTDAIKARQVMVPVRDRGGVRKLIHAENELGLGRRGLIQTTRHTVMLGGGLPRCGGRNLADAEHDFVNGRCQWCGKEAT